jgi:FkbM family methyltransferase
MPLFRSILDKQADGSFVLQWRGMDLRLRDSPGSTALESIAQDFLCDRYAFDEIELRPGELMLDVGAHVGAVSIFFAKRWPSATIHAYEPVPQNFQNLLWALQANDVHNVIPWNEAITGDGRALDMAVPVHNTGSATAFFGASHAHGRALSTSVTFAKALERAYAQRCRFLKMDCEGMEHEILLDVQLEAHVDALALEIHDSEALRRQGYAAAALAEQCSRRFGSRLLRRAMCSI